MDFLHPSEIERGVIGVLLNGGETVNTLTPEDFSDPDSRQLFGACAAIMARRERVSFEAVDSELTRAYGPEQAAALMQVGMTEARAHSLDGWQLPRFAQTVLEASKRRSLQQIGKALQQRAADPERDVNSITDAARLALSKASTASGKGVRLSEACLTVYEAAGSKEKPIPTGIHELDTILRGGLRRGELTVLGARPAVGKSALLLSMALRAAREGKQAAFVSLEMSEAQLAARVLAACSGLDASVLTGQQAVSDGEWARLATGLERAGAHDMTLLVHAGMSVEDLRAEVQDLIDGEGCDVLFVDYLQLLRTRQKTGGDFERLGIVSRALKCISLDFGIPVVAAAQVRRQGNGGILRAPGLDELRGSGDIEQDADNVLLLHRPEAGDDSTLQTSGYLRRHNGLFGRLQGSERTLLTIDVAKQRQGKTARAWTVFNPGRMTFVDPGVIGA